MSEEMVVRQVAINLAGDLECMSRDEVEDLLHTALNNIAFTARSIGQTEGIIDGLTKAERMALDAQAGGAVNGNARRNIALAAHAAVLGRIRDELAANMKRALDGGDG